MRARVALGILALAVLIVFVVLVTRKTKDFDQAMRAVGVEAENYDEAMQRAGKAMAGRDYHKAREILRAALPLAETPEQRSGVYSAIGGLFLTQKRGPEAREAFHDALAIGGISPDTRFMIYKLIAMTWDDEEKPAEVRATYARALQEKLSPRVRCLALADLAAAWRDEGKPEKAKSTYAELLKAAEAAGVEVDDYRWAITHAQNSIGAILAEEGDFAGALEAHEKALWARGGSEVFICLDVGEALIGLKRYSDARRVLAILAEDQDIVPWFLRDMALALTAEALEAEGKQDEAEQIQDQRLNDPGPTHVPEEFDAQADVARRRNIRAASFLAIGRLCLDEGDKDKARETFTRIVEMEGAPAEYLEKAQAHLDAMD